MSLSWVEVLKAQQLLFLYHLVNELLARHHLGDLSFVSASHFVPILYTVFYKFVAESSALV